MSLGSFSSSFQQKNNQVDIFFYLLKKQSGSVRVCQSCKEEAAVGETFSRFDFRSKMSSVVVKHEKRNSVSLCSS